MVMLNLRRLVSQRSRLLLAAVFALLGIPHLSGCGGPTGPAAPQRSVTRGSRTTDSRLTISDGNLFFVAGTPGVLFGTHKLTKGPETFSYLVIFKRSPTVTEKSSLSQNGGAEMSGNRGASSATIVVDGKTIAADYKIDMDESNKVRVEHLKLGGDPYDLTKGRVFVIDLTAAKPAFAQKMFDALEPIEKLSGPQDVEEVARRALESLRSELPQDFWEK
jgi:hypothetical protein